MAIDTSIACAADTATLPTCDDNDKVALSIRKEAVETVNRHIELAMQHERRTHCSNGSSSDVNTRPLWWEMAVDYIIEAEFLATLTEQHCMKRPEFRVIAMVAAYIDPERFACLTKFFDDLGGDNLKFAAKLCRKIDLALYDYVEVTAKDAKAPGL